MPFEEVESVYPDLWDWDENPVLEGVFRGHEMKNTRYGEAKMYYVSPVVDGTVADDQVAFWASAILDNKLGQISAPALVRITFDGTERNKAGNAVKQFSVQHDPAWKEGDEDIPF